MFLSVSYDYVFEYCSSESSLVINSHDLCFSNKIYGVYDVCFIGTPFGTLTIHAEKLARIWHVGT